MIKASKLKKSRHLQRQRRHLRIRNKVRGTARAGLEQFLAKGA